MTSKNVRRTIITSYQQTVGRSTLSISNTVIVGAGVPGIFEGVTGDGNVVRTRMNVPDFSGVKLLSAIDIDVTFGEDFSVEVEADANLHGLVELVVAEGILKVSVSGSLTTESPFVVHVCLPHPLDSLIVKGAGYANLHTLAQEDITLQVKGSGDIRASGAVSKLRAVVQGSGDIKLRGLTAFEAELLVQGSGDIKSTVLHAVSASVLGSGDITIYGDPPSRRTHVGGSGDIEFESQ